MRLRALAVLLLVPALLAQTGCSLATRSAASPRDLGAADRIALMDLVHRYSYTWDGRDTEGWVALFTEDAVIRATFVDTLAWSYGSDADRRRFIDGFYETMTKQGLVRTRHVQTGTILTPQPDGSVVAETMFLVAFQYRGERAPRITNSGVYRDRFVRTPAGWKFALRDILVDQR